MKIKKLKILNAGPVEKFDEELNDLTVVYAKNEKGKTALVENIALKLKEKKKPSEALYSNLREEIKGKTDIVFLNAENDGISAEQIKEKLKDTGINEFLNLITVRGAELNLTVSSSSASQTKEWLKSLFFSADAFESVNSNDYVKDYIKIENGRITGKNTGILYKLSVLKDELIPLLKIEKDFETYLEKAEVFNLEKQIKNLNTRKEELALAKRHYAYLLNEKLIFLKAEENKFNKDKLNKLNTLAHDYLRHEKEYENLLKEIEEKPDDIKVKKTKIDFFILRYSEIIEKKQGLAAYMPYAAAFLFSLTFILLFFESRIYYITAFLTFLALIIQAVFHSKIKKHNLRRAEINEIKEEYEKLFNGRFNGLTGLKIQKEIITKEYDEFLKLKEDASKKKAVMLALKKDIEIALLEFNLPADLKDILHTVKNLYSKRDEIIKAIEKNNSELSYLNIKEEDYLKEELKISYSPSKERDIERDLKNLKDELKEAENKLNAVKQFLFSKTNKGIDYYSDTFKIKDDLTSLICQKQNEIKEMKAKIIAGYITGELLREFKENEDSRFDEIIEKTNASGLIKDFSFSKYEKIYFEDGNIKLKDALGNVYDFSVLSTGAKEQALLALRIAVVQKLFSEPMFLILDDAFQYSDWDRRSALIEKTVQMVQNGWQVIYLTMDDDILNRFNEISKKIQGKYKLIKM